MSINFASKVQTQFKSIGRHDRGVKQAGFLVLYKTTMPSVLIELGFLTNEAEENFLKDTLNQMKMANSIFRAFQEYKSEIEGVNELLVDAKSYKEALSKQSVKPEKEEKPAPPKPSPADKNALIFKVQIETSRSKIPPSDARFKGLSVDEYLQDGLFKYTDGNFVYDLDAAKAHREKMVEMGFQHAFVVAFRGNERISMEEAYKMLREKK
jgi:N-acetylmuramoyl-L-alanine amidase